MCDIVKTRTALVLVLTLIVVFFSYFEYQDSNIRQVTWSFMSQNWVSLLSFFISFSSLWIAVTAYRHQTQAKIEIDSSEVWDLDLERSVLESGDETAVVTRRTGSIIDIFMENSGGCATTVKRLEIVKGRYAFAFLGRSKRAEVEWRRDFTLEQMERDGSLRQLSIWDRLEPGQRVRLLLPYVDLLDLMVTHDMLDLRRNSQGSFILMIKHVYGEAKSPAFELNLSESLRSFINERIQAFGRIIVREHAEAEGEPGDT